MFTRRNLVLAAALLVAAAGVLWYFLHHRSIDGPQRMVACLPHNGAILGFVDVEGIRRAGILDIIAGSKAAEDADYRKFVAGTGFDYRRDLTAAAGSFQSGDSFFLLSGRFDWNKLRAYALAQGGSCRDSFCRVRSSQPGRWISFYPVRSGAMALAFSSNEFAALDVAPRESAAPALTLPDAPAWAWVPASAMGSSRLPAGTQSFASPLTGAQEIVFSVARNSSGLGMTLDVTCATDVAASDLVVKLEGATNMLRKLIEREHQQPNPRDLSGLLTSGSFQRESRKVRGYWPLRREFLESLASGAVN